MDIADFLNSLNAKIAALESTETEQKKRISELEARLAQQNADSLAQIQLLKQRVESETDSHSFTRLQLEDAQESVNMGVKLLRDMQHRPGDGSNLHLTIQEKDTVIARIQSELTQERLAKAATEVKMQDVERTTQIEQSKQRALKAMVNVLVTQLKENQQQLTSYADIISAQKTEIERKFAALESPRPLSGTSHLPIPLPTVPKHTHLEELDSRFNRILDLVEEAEGKLLQPDAASSIKSSLRDAKQVIGEEIIIAHSQKDLQELIGRSTQQQLELERKANAQLMSIVSELQSQLTLYVSLDGDPSTFTLSFVSSPTTATTAEHHQT